MTLPFPPPSSLSPQFTLARCAPADVPEMVDVYLAAFRATDLSYWWPESVDAMREWTKARFGLRFADPKVQQFKVVDDETGRLVAFARWNIPEQMKGLNEGFVVYADGDGGKEDLNGADYKWMQKPPVGALEELYYAFFGGIKKMSAKWDAKTKLGLSVLCTHPDYHGRGIGKAIIEPVLAVADAEGIACYLEAAQGAKRVYEKCGYKTVEVLEFDTRQAGKEESCKLDIMIRKLGWVFE